MYRLQPIGNLFQCNQLCQSSIWSFHNVYVSCFHYHVNEMFCQVWWLKSRYYGTKNNHHHYLLDLHLSPRLYYTPKFDLIVLLQCTLNVIYDHISHCGLCQISQITYKNLLVHLFAINLYTGFSGSVLIHQYSLSLPFSSSCQIHVWIVNQNNHWNDCGNMNFNFQ